MQVLEGRRAQADGFTWSVPALSIAGEALLLTIALNAGTTNVARLVAAIVGVAAAFGAAQFFAKQARLFDLYEAAIEVDGGIVGLPSAQTDALEALPIPPNTTWAKRDWARTSGRSLPIERGWWFPRWLTNSHSGQVWVLILLLFATVDLLLGVYSVAAMFHDPHWLGSPQNSNPTAPGWTSSACRIRSRRAAASPRSRRVATAGRGHPVALRLPPPDADGAVERGEAGEAASGRLSLGLGRGKVAEASRWSLPRASS